MTTALPQIYSSKQILTITRSILLCQLLQSPILLGPQITIHIDFWHVGLSRHPSQFQEGNQERFICLSYKKNETYYDTSATPSTPPQGHKASGMLSTPNFIPNTVTPLLNCFLMSSSPSCTLFWL